MEVRKAALIGGGVIGAGWAARLIENGIDAEKRKHARRPAVFLGLEFPTPKTRAAFLFNETKCRFRSVCAFEQHKHRSPPLIESLGHSNFQLGLPYIAKNEF